MITSRHGSPRRHRSLLACAVAALAAAALPVAASTPSAPSASAASPGRLPAQTSATGTWTLIYYGVADNDLEAALVSDVQEMTKAGFGGQVQLYALLDRSPTDHSDPYGEYVDGPLGALGDFDSTKVFHVDGDQLVEDLDIGEADMADPDTLGWFVSEIMRIAPADHTALILSDHGAGAYRFGFDDTTSTVMTAQDVATGIRSGLAPSGGHLDIVAFDACLMANFETTSWMAEYADLLVASEDVIPGTGFRYDDLTALTEAPDMTPDELASLLVESYSQQYGTSEFADTTLSVTDLSSTALVDRAVGTLADALVATESHVGFRTALADSTSLMELDTSYGFVDLGDLARRLAQPGFPDTVRNAADAVFSAVDQAVVDSWGGLARGQSSGMSIAVPTDADMFDALDYAVLGNPSWSAWLESLFAQGGTPGATSGLWATDLPDLESIDENGLVISAPLDTDAVDEFGLTDTVALFGDPTDDGGMAVRLSYPAITDSGEPGRVAASWAFQLFRLGDGTTEVDPWTSLAPSDAVITGTIGGRYSADGVTLRSELGFSLDPEGGGISSVELWVFDEASGWASIAPVAGSTFSARLIVVSPDGSELTEQFLEPLSFDAGVTIEQIEVASGADISAGLGAADGTGAISTVFGTTQRP